MLERDGLPPYPPSRNAHQVPPPPVSRRWRWVAVVGTVAAFSATVAMGATAVVLGTRDYPGLIQDEGLVRTIEAECDIMRSTVESVPVEGTLREQAEAIRDQNVAVGRMIGAIRDAEPQALLEDRPATQWLDDWGALLTARNRFVLDLLEQGAAALEIPTDDAGEDIYVRMDDVFADGSVCEVPVTLLSPYPGTETDV